MTPTATGVGPEPTPPTCKHCGQPVEVAPNPWTGKPDWIHSDDNGFRIWGCGRGSLGTFAEVKLDPARERALAAIESILIEYDSHDAPGADTILEEILKAVPEWGQGA